MKFTINTTYTASAGWVVLKGVAKRLSESGHSVARNDWEYDAPCDVAIFMAPDSKIRELKEKDPRVLCGLFDPKANKTWQKEEIKAADFLVVSSIEQREFFLKYNKNVLIYYMFPDVSEIPKVHEDKKKIVIGYHGNKQHLDAMADVSQALDALARHYDIELRVIYNIKQLGRWHRNTPKLCKVEHVQWTEETCAGELSKCDIGISPSLLPALHWFARPLRSYIPFCNPEGYNVKDYVQRFKCSNNPGRIYVFSQLSIPVVTDFTPSSCQLISDGVSGFLVGTAKGWEVALEKLIKSASLRQNIAENFKQSIETNCSVQKNFEGLVSSIKNLYDNRQ